MGYEREIDAVLRWVEETDRIALEHFRVDVPYETKRDGTPVTAADRGVEASLRRAIEAEFAGDAVIGEEEGETGSSPRRWIIDPIDGTKNFSRGIPVFATLIALEDDGVLALGMVSAPALGTRWWSTRGGGAYRNGEAIRVSQVRRIDDADVCSGGIDWARASGHLDGVLRLCADARRSRGFGDFWGHVLVAQGSCDAMVEHAPLAWWDIAAPRAIVAEAGGRMTDLAGWSGVRSGACVTSNGILHDEVLGYFKR